MKQIFRLAENFVSINGEGQHAGELALFLRFTGCNLRCSWCDTMWANTKGAPHRDTSLEELVDIVKTAMSRGVNNVTLTGGEPLLHEGMDSLIEALVSLGIRVEIETNGSVDIAPFISAKRPVFTVDYKLPSSGMEEHMRKENIPLLNEADTLKMVCGSAEDLRRAYEVIRETKPRCKVYLSPVFGDIEPAEIVDFMKEKGLGNVRLQLQLHKFIWDPHKRGV